MTEEAAELRRVLRREEDGAAAEEGSRQTASVEIWVGRWMVEGMDAREGATGARRERESEKEAKGRLVSSCGGAPAPALESAGMVGEMRESGEVEIRCG
jgi:hypothetical protein